MSAEHPDLLSELKERLDRLESELAAAHREIERKNQIIESLIHRQYGKASERIDPAQLQLEFGEDVLGKCEVLPPTPCDGEGCPEEEGAGKGSPKQRSKKKDLFPRNLPVIVGEVIVPAEVAAHPEAYTEIGEEYHDDRRTMCNGLEKWFVRYNMWRPHETPGNETPASVYATGGSKSASLSTLQNTGKKAA